MHKVGQAVRAGATIPIDARVELVPGTNVVFAVARSDDDIKSYSNVLEATSTRSEASAPGAFVLAVGIDKYGGDSRAAGRDGAGSIVQRGGKALLGNLAFAANDARAFASRYSTVIPRSFEVRDVRLLLDGQAKRSNILASLAQFASSANTNDMVVVYLAGHGQSRRVQHAGFARQRYFYAPYDYESIDALEARGLSSDDLLSALGSIRANHILLLLDTCESGAADEAFANDVFGALRLFGEESGIYVLASAAASQTAAERSDLQHGVFTAALLDQLACKGPMDLTFTQLASATEAAVQTILGGARHQTVVATAGGYDPTFVGCPPRDARPR